MARTLVQTLADFTVDSTYDRLPAEVVEECKRLVLDSIGCALAATEDLKGRAGIDYGRLIGGSNGPATIMGTGDKVSVLGAAFANGELINTLDMDSLYRLATSRPTFCQRRWRRQRLTADPARR